MEVTPRRPRLSRGWIALLLGILTLGLTTTWIILSQQILSKPVIASTPIATAFSRWERLADLPTARSGLAAATYDNQIYVIGGETAQGVTGKVESFDPVTNSWQTKSPKPLPVADVGAAMIAGKIFVPGGRLESGEVTNIMEVYDPYLDLWEQGEALPKALSAYALVAFEGKLFLFGGWDGHQYLDSVFVYDPSLGVWVTRTPMPTRRGFAGAAVVGGKIYVVGGTAGGEKAFTVNEAYSPNLEGVDNPWESFEPLPSSRTYPGVGSVADVVYILGSANPEEPFSFIAYLPQMDKWEAFETPPVSAENELALISLGEYLYAIGGTIEGEQAGFLLAYRAVYTVGIPVIIK